ncbi:hypothetical protein [Pararhizobium gei]|uniref:hypothetical protein n=1 Tax=Pararhizobium gei TaxID=1395951 RepID=UPI0023DB7588|nr:hypothetical protein [Rhizobium gei]
MTETARPQDALILEALERLLSSAVFARSERLRAFLKYVVEREMEGNGHQLKGYTIGIDVFDRPQAFNADSDPLVRVHAGKLRKLMAAYYAGEGAKDDWRIDIPKGSYVPIYSRHNQPPGPEPERIVVAAPRRRPAWRPAPFSSPLALLSVLPLLIFVPLSSPAMSVSIPTPARLHGAVVERKFAGALPRITIRTEGPKRGKAARFGDAFGTAASHYRTITIAPARSMSANPRPDADPLAFTVTIAEEKLQAGLRVVIVQDASSTILHESLIDQAHLAADADILFESLALAEKALSADGDLYRYARRTLTASPLMACMALTDTYGKLQTREAFHEARSCQEDLSSEHRRKLQFVISAGALPFTLAR